MRFTSSATAVVVVLAATSALAAPVPSHLHEVEESTPNHHHRHQRHHHHHHHHHHGNGHPLPYPDYHVGKHHAGKHAHVSHERIGLGKWIQQHVHYPHYWPFHPHHQTEVDHKDEDAHKAGSMFSYWLHSHSAPHTGGGEPLLMQARPSSAFDNKPDPPRNHQLAARDLDPLASLTEEDHEQLTDHHVKVIHKEMKKLDKLMEKEMKKAQKEVHHAAKEMHLHVGMAAAKLGHGDMEIDELD